MGRSQRAVVIVGTSVWGLSMWACGDASSRLDAGTCWPLPSTPGGSVTIGTGDVAYEPLGDVVDVVKNAIQSDPHLRIHARIRGMPPGNPDDAFDPANPRTRVSAEIPELGITLGVLCPASLGYVPASNEEGAYDLPRSLRAGFGSYPLANVDGKQARLVVEVISSDALYATDEKTVTLHVPPADAGVDASVVDAP